MLLRIEDTDRERSTKAAIDAILDGLTWLGIGWDGDVVYQYSRAARHREVAEALLSAGHAYRCYASQQELDEMREQARREGRSKLVILRRGVSSANDSQNAQKPQQQPVQQEAKQPVPTKPVLQNSVQPPIPGQQLVKVQ